MAYSPKKDVTACETFLSLYKEAMDTAKSLIDIPRKFLRKMQDMVDYPIGRVTSMLSDITSRISNLSDSFDLGVTDFLKSLNKLISCPVVADSALGKQAATIMDAITGGASTANGALGTLASMASGIAKSALDNIKGLLDNSITGLSKQYTALLDSCGVTSVMNTLTQLETCISDLCASYTAFTNMTGKVTGYFQDGIPDLDTLLGYVTEGGKKVLSCISQPVLDLWQEASDRYEAAKKTLSAFNEKANTAEVTKQ